MCGIAGIVGPAASDAVLTSMLREIRHRGDPECFAEVRSEPRVAFGTNRLAIVDPAHGRQPFSVANGSVLCIANGEIYNAAALRDELSSGYSFGTLCDTEVILAAYLRWGDELVRHLRGMFAIAVADRARGLFLARDPLGIKPLYLAEHQGTFFFASEMKGLAVPPIAHASRVEELAPGSTWLSGTQRRYWDVPSFGDSSAGAASMHDEVRAAAIDAVACHLPEAGSPLACLLSGGVDSSTVLYLAKRLHRGPIQAWTLAAAGSDSSDRRAAETLCRELDIPLHVVTPAVEDMTRFYLEHGVRMTETWEPALVRNAVSYHFLCRVVRDAGHKLCLSGEGADEVFGGYDYFWRIPEDARDAAVRSSLLDVHRTYLLMADRASMASALEVRVPYLDKDFVERCVRLPPTSRFAGKTNKRALREAFPEALPEGNRTRAKIGMNAGAGFGSNDPGEGIYHDAVSAFYAKNPAQARSDRAVAADKGKAFGVAPEKPEEVYNFVRYVEAGFHRLGSSRGRPQLNVSNLVAPMEDRT